MSSETLLLRSFDRFGKLCEFDPASGRARWLRKPAGDSAETVGFVKSFWFGPALAVYTLDGEWHLQIHRQRWRLDDPRLRFEARPSGMRTTLLVDTPDGHYRCVDVAPLGWFVSRMDPTYDALDAEADDFPRWLAGLRGKARGG